MKSNESINRPRKRTAPPQALFKNAGEFAHDVFTLAELQAALLKQDLTRGFWRLLKITLAMVLAAVLALCCVPLLLIAWAYVLNDWGLSMSLSFATSAATGLLLAAATAGGAWMWFRRSGPLLTRSMAELKNNIAWLKQVLSQNTSSATAA